MILATRINKTVPLATLGKKCAEYGGYTYPLEDGVGLLHVPYVKFLKAEYNIQASLAPIMTIRDIAKTIDNDGFVIVSVSPEIRDPHSKPKTKGGHLVLVVGYDLSKKCLFLHNPSGNNPQSQAFAKISFTDFSRFFTNRGIIIT